jgi:uncharacterized protein YgiM (DUF1202 family)
MKKVLFVFCMVLFITGIASAGGEGESSNTSNTTSQSQGQTMYVAINSAELKSGTGAFANTVGALKYGERVTVLQTSGRFMEVRSDVNQSLRGWTAEANLTTRQVVPGAGGSATDRDVAMAGKGFNQEVENSFRSQNRNLNYNDVDRVETMTTINQTELRRFLEEGRLAMGDN